MEHSFDLQPVLQNHLVKLVPLKTSDLEALYKIASDPLIWEQHPDKYRYEMDVFKNYFEGAITSGGAFLIMDLNGNVIGSSRYYELDRDNSSVAIGYTFLGREWWGGEYNKAVKKLMLEHAFKYVDSVLFHIGASNLRSQKALEKLGGSKFEEKIFDNNGLHYTYKIDKSSWDPSKS